MVVKHLKNVGGIPWEWWRGSRGGVGHFGWRVFGKQEMVGWELDIRLRPVSKCVI